MIAVCSRSITRSKSAIKILKKNFKKVKLNNTNQILKDEDLVNFLKNAKATIIGLEKIDRDLLDKCPNLKVIAKYGVGTNNIDFDQLKKRNIKILLQPGINKRAVSEITLNFMIMSLRNTIHLINDVKNNKWPFLFGRLLSTQTVGIIGFGNIGADLFKLLKPFKCKILANDLDANNTFFSKHKIKNTSIKKVLSNSDIISIHIPLNKRNILFFSKSEFSLMKKNATLINTSRGGIVDEKHLYNFLFKNSESKAFFDVMLKEPINNLKLLKLNNFFLTPHLAGSTVEIAESASKDCVQKLVKFFYK
tara:strand:- start:984 stop:1901 length:918 start_codon:yes stop_codon:yes gene_type:complete